MKQLTKMTNRSKMMVLILSFFTVTLILYGILPLAASGKEWRQCCMEYEMRMEQIQEKIYRLPEIRKEHDSMSIKLKQMETWYLPCLHNSEIDRLLTSCFTEHGICVEDLKLIVPEKPFCKEESCDGEDCVLSVWNIQAEVKLSGEQKELENVLKSPHLEQNGIRLVGFQWKDSMLLIRLDLFMKGK